ncbi:MAG: hypothetical protein WC515_08440 [Candidatus Omnitrophota bacterium]
MTRSVSLILAAIMIAFAPPAGAQVDDEDGAYNTQVPEGMELQQVGKKPSYKVVLPKGTAIRREGDLRIIEGSGEYAARKFTEYDAILAKMNDDIESVRKDMEDLKKTISEMQKPRLASK